MIVRYTFAVCMKCGVQSPPVILSNRSALRIATEGLQKQGWVYKGLQFNIQAICPKCADEKTEVA